MANPRQRSKARSHKSTKPSHAAKRRMHHRLRKPPPLKGPEVLQQGWDSHKTVFQNYEALGLLASLPLPNGSSSSRSYRARLKLPLHIVPGEDVTENDEDSGPRAMGFGQIIRDEEGNVVDIIMPEEEAGIGEDDGEPASDEETWAAVEGKTEVIRSLEQIAAGSKPVNRHSSKSERTWLREMVEKYNDDYGGMSRDKSLNVWQKTEGEIKRMIRKAGGIDKLR